MNRELLANRLREFNSLWTALEKRMAEEMCFTQTEVAAGHYHFLGWRRQGAEWKICVRESGVVSVWKPILECTAKERVDYAEYTPHLWAETVRAHESLAVGVEGATIYLKAMIELEVVEGATIYLKAMIELEVKEWKP